MKKLYQAITINKLELKNRVVMAPMGIGNTVNGYSTARDVEFFRARAKGEPGLMIYANIQFDPIRYNPKSGARLSDECFVPDLQKVTAAVHEEGVPIFAQLMHQGRYGSTRTSVGGEIVAPSAVPTRFNGNEMPRALTVEEIGRFVQWQVEAGRLAKMAGFDGIEIETNSGYLFGQFFSPLTNKREDQYGGTLVNRCRFLIETLQALRKELGPDFPLTVRVGGNDFVPGSCNNEDICEICQILDESGCVDAISVTGGWHEAAVPLITMELPHATYAYLGKAIKSRVKCPVMMSNRMDIPSAEELVERGDVDMIVMARPWLAEPNLVRLAKQGRTDEIRPCIGCNAGCLDPVLKNKRCSCISNRECNNELELMDNDGLLPTQLKSETPQRILIIGGGPAGLEFARVSALRGHQVTLWEKNSRCGGQLLLAAVPPRRGDIARLVEWLERSCLRLGVDIIYNWQAEVEDVLNVIDSYDSVIVACGARPAVPNIPIDPAMQVVQAWDVLEKNVDTGKRVVVIGGGATGLECGLYLAEIGTLSAEQLRFMMIFEVEPYDKLQELLNRGSKTVSVIEQQHSPGSEINPGARWSMIARARKLGMSLICDATVEEVRSDSVVICSNGKRSFIPADTVVLAAGSVPENDLYQQLSAAFDRLSENQAVPFLTVIGDADSIGNAQLAICSAYDVAAKL